MCYKEEEEEGDRDGRGRRKGEESEGREKKSYLHSMLWEVMVRTLTTSKCLLNKF